MGTSMETEVIFVSLDRSDLQWKSLSAVEGEQVNWSPITYKAAKKLKEAQPGDTIEVIFDYGTSLYDVIQARRVTGSDSEKIRLLAARIERLERIVGVMEKSVK